MKEMAAPQNALDNPKGQPTSLYLVFRAIDETMKYVRLESHDSCQWNCVKVLAVFATVKKSKTGQMNRARMTAHE